MSTEQVKPGDLAVIQGWGHPSNNGKLVDVISRAPMNDYTLPGTSGRLGTFVNEHGTNNFIVESLGAPLITNDGVAFQRAGAARSCLRPIRTPPGQDETLRWADVPRNDYADAGFMPLGD